MGEPYTSYRIPASTRASARYGPFQPGGLLAGFSTRSRRLSGNFPTSPMYPYVPFLGSPTIAVCILASSSYVCPARFASIRDAANGASTAAMTATMSREVKVSRRVKPRIGCSSLVPASLLGSGSNVATGLFGVKQKNDKVQGEQVPQNLPKETL